MRHTFTAAVLAACLVASLPAVSSADQFSFSIGGHGHGHGHHHHHHSGWSFGYWAPPPPRYVYVAPQPVYVQPPIIQQPVIIQQAPPAAAYSTNAASVTPNSLPAPPVRTVASSSPVVIRNNNGKGAAVAFLLNDKAEELRDGQARSFTGSGQVIEFDRGGELGTARYELSGGLYQFTVSENGWDLVKDTVAPRTADRPALRKNELPLEVRKR